MTSVVSSYGEPCLLYRKVTSVTPISISAVCEVRSESLTRCVYLASLNVKTVVIMSVKLGELSSSIVVTLSGVSM